jgi:hypothetical protein
MRINSFGEFNFYVRTKHLERLHPSIANFCQCVSRYQLLCNCQRNEKQKKGVECNAQYIEIVNSILPAVKSQLFSDIQEHSIEFYNNGTHLINVLTR